jgi:Rad3-related DNA helicase
VKFSSVAIASDFPPERRPIYIHPVADMSKKNKDHAYPILLQNLRAVLLKHPQDRVLVHTVSYALNTYIQTELSDLSSRLVSYGASSEKQRAIDRYLYTEGSVLLAPSLDRGIDLPGDDCRVIVVCKIPFPSLGDKQISAKLYAPGGKGKQWYAVKTVRSLVQMTGRGMRSPTDFCESYILDANFISNIWRRHKNLLPQWWKDAVDMKRPPLI